jgi:branched-chain amino acid transport system ATP-binding protein
MADHWGIRTGMLLMTPVFLIGGLVLSSAGSLIEDDIHQVWQATAAMAEVTSERRRGGGKLLLVRGLNVSYNGVQVLFGIDFDVDSGQTVALLGTNGAGKSTLLKAIAGVVAPDRGAVVIDGRESTWAPANEVAQRGIVLFPGGAGVFPSLTVTENLDTAEWLVRRNQAQARSDRQRVLELFPALASKGGRLAGDLSGGEQQMLALAMALMSRPRLLMIDELSLGLAPIVVEELLGAVRGLQQEGITIVLVEQSVNLALTVAETAYFMEKGEIRFHGPTAELLDRPDLLRSVFLPTVDAGPPTAAQVSGNGADSPPDVAPSIETRSLCRSFGGIAALVSVDLEVRPNEILGVIGPNGAGKTTLFDVMTGYTSADSRQVLIGGEDVTSLSAARRAWKGLGRSFQDGRLFPAMTVADNIAVALERWTTVRDPFRPALHLPSAYDAEQRIRRRVDELLDVLSLGGYRDKFVRELSTGTRRVVDLACLLAHRPTVILLDEPSSGIAQREAETLVPLLLRIRAETGASLVVIEHDMAVVTAVADRLVAMDRGGVVASGDCKSVLEDARVVESYLGAGSTALARSGPRRTESGTQR